MSNIPQRWIIERYVRLRNAFKTKEFSVEEAERVLDEGKAKRPGKRIDKITKVDITRRVQKILNEMVQAGWATEKLHPKDRKKRLYCLREASEVFTDMEI